MEPSTNNSVEPNATLLNPNKPKPAKFARCKFTNKILRDILMAVFYYMDIAKDIVLIVEYHKRGLINYVIYTSIILAVPSFFMILFFTLAELAATAHSIWRKILNCICRFFYFITQFHVVKCYISSIRKYYKYCQIVESIKGTLEYDSVKKQLVLDPRYILKMFKMNEVLFESFPQMILQSVLLYKDYKEYNYLDILQYKQIFSISFGLITISWSCMGFSREIAFNRAKLKLRSWLFMMSRSTSNILLLISRVIPLVFLIKYFKWILLIALVRFVVLASVSFLFQVPDFNKASDNKLVCLLKKISLSIAFSVLKTISFFEEFEFSLSYTIYHGVMIAENVAMYAIYLIYSKYNFFDYDVLFRAGLILGCLPFGLLIELIYWKCFKPAKEKRKFDLKTISENVHFSLAI